MLENSTFLRMSNIHKISPKFGRTPQTKNSTAVLWNTKKLQNKKLDGVFFTKFYRVGSLLGSRAIYFTRILRISGFILDFLRILKYPVILRQRNEVVRQGLRIPKLFLVFHLVKYFQRYRRKSILLPPVCCLCLASAIQYLSRTEKAKQK